MASTLRSKATRSTGQRLGLEDYRALGAFRFALRSFLAFSEAEARKQGLTPQQHQALLGVKAHVGPEPITVGELADWLLIRNHSALGLVTRLAAKGLLTRAASARDRRRVVISLTAAGESALEDISRNNLGKLKRNAPTFETLLHALDRLELPTHD